MEMVSYYLRLTAMRKEHKHANTKSHTIFESNVNNMIKFRHNINNNYNNNL
jgi:hypothetical protein